MQQAVILLTVSILLPIAALPASAKEPRLLILPSSGEGTPESTLVTVDSSLEAAARQLMAERSVAAGGLQAALGSSQFGKLMRCWSVECWARAGSALAPDLLLVAQVTVRDDELVFWTRLLDLEKGAVVATQRPAISSETDAIRAAAKEAIEAAQKAMNSAPVAPSAPPVAVAEPVAPVAAKDSAPEKTDPPPVSVRRRRLGVRARPVTKAIARRRSAQNTAGALVAKVSPKGVGADAGIRQGDILLELDGRPITAAKLPKMVATAPLDRAVTLEIWRDGGPKKVQVHFGRPALSVQEKAARAEQELLAAQAAATKASAQTAPLPAKTSRLTENGSNDSPTAPGAARTKAIGTGTKALGTTAPSVSDSPKATAPPTKPPRSRKPSKPLADAVFEAMTGERVEVERTDGTVFEGLLKLVKGKNLVVVLDDGAIILVPKTGVAKLRAAVGNRSAPAATPGFSESGDVTGQASAPMPAECARIPQIMADLRSAESKMSLAKVACEQAGSLAGGAATDALSSFIPMGGLFKSLADTALSAGASAACENLAESVVFDKLRSDYEALNQRCYGDSATPFQSSQPATSYGGASRGPSADELATKALLDAVEKGDVDEVKSMMASHRDLGHTQPDGDICSLHIAVRNGNMEMTRALLNGAEFEWCWALGEGGLLASRTPHYLAAENGNLEMFRLLMDHHTPIGKRGGEGMPVFRAVDGMSIIDHFESSDDPEHQVYAGELRALARRTSDSWSSPTLGYSTAAETPYVGLELMRFRFMNFQVANGYFYIGDGVGGGHIGFGAKFPIGPRNIHQVGFIVGVLGAEVRWKEHTVYNEETGDRLSGFEDEDRVGYSFSAGPIELAYRASMDHKFGIEVGLTTFAVNFEVERMVVDSDSDSSPEEELAEMTLFEPINLWVRLIWF